MNKEQIIQMAREAGATIDTMRLVPDTKVRLDFDSFDDLERFAAAIRIATKEEDAKICEDEEDAHMVFDNWQAAKALDVAAERIRASK